MSKCSYCDKEFNSLPFKCKFCGEEFCIEHQLPENHECEGLDKWKRGELKKFKKEIGPPKQRWKPFRLFELQRKKHGWIVLIIIFLIIFVLIYFLR